MYIYLIGNEYSKQKIGYSSNPLKRLRSIQVGNPERLFLHYTIEVKDEQQARIVESLIHREIMYKKIKGEWFNISVSEAKTLLNFAEITWVN